MNNYFNHIPSELSYSILGYIDYSSLINLNRAFRLDWEEVFKFLCPALYSSINFILHMRIELYVEGIWYIIYKNILQMNIKFETDLVDIILENNLFDIILENNLVDIIYTFDKVFLEIIYINGVLINFRHLYKYYLKLVNEGIESILAIEWIYNYEYDDMELIFPLVNKKPIDIFGAINKDKISNRDVLMFFLLYHDRPEMKMTLEEYEKILIDMIAYDSPGENDSPREKEEFGSINYKQILYKLRDLYNVVL